MNKLSIPAIRGVLQKVFMILFLVALPFNSFPHFPNGFGGDALVRPLSIFPLIALLVLVTLPHLFSKPLPSTFIPLLPFVLIAIVSSLYALLQGIDSLLGVSVAQRILRALITLGIGTAIYMTVSLWAETSEDLRFMLRWIYVGFGIALLWGSLQAIYVVRFSPTYFNWINNIQRYLSTRTLFHTRVSGLTYEPNWFADQICLLLLPWLLASILRGYSVFRWRWRRLSIEWLLLVWAVTILAFTFSRAGLILLLIMVFVSLMFFRGTPNRPNLARVAVHSGWARRSMETSFALLVIIGFLYLTGANNSFFSRVWDYWSQGKKPNLVSYFEYLGFGARMTYSLTAFNIYENHPVIGVGLGNYAFYFEEMLPDHLLAETPEILHILTQNATRYRLITPKNLYLRVLAETGVVGFGAFLAFIIAIFGCVISLGLSPQPEPKFWGTGGLYAFISFSFLALSFDSFAIPNMWIAFGLITAATRIFPSPSEGKQNPPTPVVVLGSD